MGCLFVFFSMLSPFTIQELGEFVCEYGIVLLLVAGCWWLLCWWWWYKFAGCPRAFGGSCCCCCPDASSWLAAIFRLGLLAIFWYNCDIADKTRTCRMYNCVFTLCVWKIIVYTLRTAPFKKIDKMRVAFSVLLCVWCWEVEFASIFTITNPQINKLRWQLLFVYNNTQKHELQIFECHPWADSKPKVHSSSSLLCCCSRAVECSNPNSTPRPSPAINNTTNESNRQTRLPRGGVLFVLCTFLAYLLISFLLFVYASQRFYLTSHVVRFLV